MKKKLSKKFGSVAGSSKQMVLISEEMKFNVQKDPDSHYLEIINLRHPRDDRSAKFIFNNENNTICEILKFSLPHRSWFIGNYINSDGSMYLSTSIDPLFLVLPYLFESKQSSTFDQIIHDENFRDSVKLEALVDADQLSFIADKRDVRGLIVWKYNEEKTLSWLGIKVNRVANVLEEKNINVNTSCAVSNTFVKTEKDATENYLRFAHGMISDYLPSALSEKLLNFLRLPSLETMNAKKRKNVGLDAEEIKKIKMEHREKEIAEAEIKAGSKNEKNIFTLRLFNILYE